jgi:hypothetical protein
VKRRLVRLAQRGVVTLSAHQRHDEDVQWLCSLHERGADVRSGYGPSARAAVRDLERQVR